MAALEIVKALHNNDKDFSYIEVEAEQGHDAFLMKIPYYMDTFSAYMGNVK